MKSLALKVRRFLVSEDGPTAVEYAVMLALIIIVCLTAISSIGTNANTTFTDVAASIARQLVVTGCRRFERHGVRPRAFFLVCVGRGRRTPRFFDLGL